MVSRVDIRSLSFESFVGQYDEECYRQKNGVPTGGSLCVQIANIAVFYYTRKEVYSDLKLMENVKAVKRFIDDGSGFFSGSKRQFAEFINTINEKISKYGLNMLNHQFTL